MKIFGRLWAPGEEVMAPATATTPKQAKILWPLLLALLWFISACQPHGSGEGTDIEFPWSANDYDQIQILASKTFAFDFPLSHLNCQLVPAGPYRPEAKWEASLDAGIIDSLSLLANGHLAPAQAGGGHTFANANQLSEAINAGEGGCKLLAELWQKADTGFLSLPAQLNVVRRVHESAGQCIQVLSQRNDVILAEQQLNFGRQWHESRWPANGQACELRTKAPFAALAWPSPEDFSCVQGQDNGQWQMRYHSSELSGVEMKSRQGFSRVECLSQVAELALGLAPKTSESILYQLAIKDVEEVIEGQKYGAVDYQLAAQVEGLQFEGSKRLYLFLLE